MIVPKNALATAETVANASQLAPTIPPNPIATTTAGKAGAGIRIEIGNCPPPIYTAPTSRAGFNPAAPLLVDRIEAARMMGVSPGTIDNLRTRGEIPSVKIAARRLFDPADMRRFIESRRMLHKPATIAPGLPGDAARQNGGAA